MNFGNFEKLITKAIPTNLVIEIESILEFDKILDLASKKKHFIGCNLQAFFIMLEWLPTTQSPMPTSYNHDDQIPF
jgi:hypothetical protein